MGEKIPPALTPEQRARDMLERMGVKRAQSMTAGDVVELANLIARHDELQASDPQPWDYTPGAEKYEITGNEGTPPKILPDGLPPSDETPQT